MKIPFFLISGLFLLFSSFGMNAQFNKFSALSREKALQEASTSSDSINILLDVFSLSDKINRDLVRARIRDVAQKSDNAALADEMINELAKITDDTRELKRLIEISDSLPDSDSRKPLKTLLLMEKAAAEASNASDSQIRSEVMEFEMGGIGIGTNTDPYKEIQNIYRAMMYLGASSQGPLYLEYIKRLEELIKELPENDHAIRNLFYTTAALFYTRKRDYQKAIEMDRHLIKELDVIKNHKKKIGEKDEELDLFYFVSYRRMLRNFQVLTPEEIDDIYAKCIELAKNNEKIAEAMKTEGLTNSYYYIGKKDFKNAVPELRKALKAPNISTFRRQELLGLLAWALNETGQHKEELDVLREYTYMMLAEREQRVKDTYREIEIRNTVNKMIADEYREQEQQREENRDMRKTSLTLVYVLAVILIFMCQAYFRLRHKVKDLESRNKKLRRNIEDIFDDGIPKGTKDLRHQKNRLKG